MHTHIQRYTKILRRLRTCIGTHAHSHIRLHTHAHTAEKKNYNWLRPQPTEGGQSCIRGQISSWGCRVHCGMSCLGWLAQSRKSAQGTKNPFHITHHPMLLAALSFTGQSCRELIGMSSEFQRWQLYSSWHLFSFLFTSLLKKIPGWEKNREEWKDWTSLR